MKFYKRELIEYFLEGTATEIQLTEILDQVYSDDEFRRELAEASRMRGLLVTLNNQENDSVYRGVSRSIAEMEPESLELKILESLEDGVPQVKNVYKDNKKWLGYFWAGIAAQIAVIFFLYNAPVEDSTVYHGSLYSESGQAWLIRDGKTLGVNAEMRLRDGDRILVDDKGDLQVTWNDSTVTQFKDETEASFSLKTGAKHIQLVKGKIQAQVTKQAPGLPMVIKTPNSKVTVLGTRFRLKANQNQSLLQVDHGSVEIENMHGESLVVNAHQYAVASKKQRFEARKFNRPVYVSPEVNLDTPGMGVDIVAEINGVDKLFLVVHSGADGRGFDHAAWLNPVLENALGRQYSLLDSPWKYASSEWGKMGIGTDALGKKLTHMGKVYSQGIGTHAISIIEYDIPVGYKLFKSKGVITDSGSSQAKTRSSVVFEIYTEFPEHRYRSMKVDLKSKK